MISIAQAEAKFRQLDPHIDPDVEALGKAILHRRKYKDFDPVLTQKNHDDSPTQQGLLHFIEQRLAQPHLGFLKPDQVNHVWGGSTTVALQKLGLRHALHLDPATLAIGSDFLRAVLDGTKSAEAPLPAANSYDWLKAQVLAHNGFLWTNVPGEFNVLGLRGYMVPEGAVPNIGDRWNDTLFVAWIDGAGKKRVRTWVASTDPGLYYYHTRPINPHGCAHVVAPQQIRYRPGRHGSQQQPAFVQDSNITVARTNSANYTDRTRRFTDTPGARFWCNLHAGFAWGNSDSVGASSAGCQTTKGEGWTDWRWLGLRDLLQTDPRGWFLYTLLNSQDLKH